VEKQLLSPDNSGANAPLNAPPGVSGNSVLSSLLALYNSQQSMDSTTTTAVTSAVTTPASSRPPSPSASDEPPSTPRRHFWQRRAPGVRDEQAGGDTSRNSGDSASFTEKKRSKSQTSIADRDEPDRGFLAAVARQVEEFRHDRPKAARSGAGVFGALIGSTGGMAAAAVPAASTLIPAAKRPGYHLTRYSLVEEPPSPRFKPPSRPSSTANISGLRSRPSSTSALNGLWDAAQTEGSQSRPTSLYSTYEGTGTGATNDTLREAKISDNLLMMKSKAKRSSAAINPLNLKAVKSAETWLGKSFDDLSRVSEDDRRRKEAAAEKRRKKKAREARKKHEVFIIRHVAAIITRQQFILKLARSLMMFGSPTHRIETQIQATAKVLDINCQVVYLPNTMLM
jgi:hypothetical protein